MSDAKKPRSDEYVFDGQPEYVIDASMPPYVVVLATKDAKQEIGVSAQRDDKALEHAIRIAEKNAARRSARSASRPSAVVPG